MRRPFYSPQTTRPLGIRFNDTNALVCIGADDAELRVFPADSTGAWQAPITFPFPTGVTTLTAIGPDNSLDPTRMAQERWRSFCVVTGTANASPIPNQ